MRSFHAGWIWISLAICALVILGAMTWLTRGVIASEAELSSAEVRADLQERMRLSLWRMDAAGSAMLIEESQRPVDAFATGRRSSVPLRMRFEIARNGLLVSQDHPELLPDLRVLLEKGRDHQAVFQALWGKLEGGTSDWSTPSVGIEPPPFPEPLQKQARVSEVVQKAIGRNELLNRGRMLDQTVAKGLDTQNAFQMPAAGSSLQAGLPRPFWINGELMLLRVVTSPGARASQAIQGVWLDADSVKQLLLAESADLLPTARLKAAVERSDDGMVLASFPFRLDAGTLSSPPPGLREPILLSLIAGWCAAVLAILAASMLVRGVIRLSERRASFVSAVTHELRTPLTTFQLYSDLLGSPGVSEEKRSHYVRVLSLEAARLSHLVENVLAFSGIERGNPRSSVRAMGVAELLEPMRHRLENRLATADLRLDMEITTASPVNANPDAVEHILFNLIDNASKYASGSSPPLVEIRVISTASHTSICVADHGPGIPATERQRIFRAFHKSAHDAAETRPGVGLGLALSRSLARSLGGDLLCTEPPSGKGASFIVKLPRSDMQKR